MKKTTYCVFLLLLVAALVFWGQSFFGLNISASELLRHYIPSLKLQSSSIAKNLDTLTLTPYVKNLNKPRFMHITKTGDLLVADADTGQILLIPYKNPQKKYVLIAGLKKPHSMDIYQNYLYVAEEKTIGRIQFDENNGSTKGSYEPVIKNMPDDGGHWTRTLKFGPDGYGYVSIGSSCNVCMEKNDLRATISRFKPGESQLKVYATGLRNSVGFDWSPIDKKLYATDNGRDFLGDDFPPDELNIIEQNQFYGWPYANGNRIPDPEFGSGREAIIKKSIPPVFEFGAHSAALGITFIKNPQSILYGKALVVFHGSWNRSVKVGYKVVSLSFDNGKIIQQDFINGFLQHGKVLGRPVHIVEGKDGELYLSDDFAGNIYLITLKKSH